MPEVIYYVAMSVDGYIATPDGGIGWLAPFENTGEDYGYAAFYASVDAVLMGRATYAQCRAWDPWPYAGKACRVFSHTPLGAPPPQVVVTAQTPSEVLAELAAHGHRRVWLVGGGTLAAAFQEAGRIDEYIVSVIPRVLGHGIPLFSSHGPMAPLSLTGTTAYPNGIVQLRYVRDGKS